jgi:hypothetical protein
VDVTGSAQRATGRVVVIAPTALYRDPDLAEVRDRDPALLAWSATLAGAGLDETFRADLLRAQSPDGHLDGDESVLSTACALVAWSAADSTDEAAASARQRAMSALGNVRFGDADGSAGEIRAQAALLGALAPSGIADVADALEGAIDPLARMTAQYRGALRRTLRRYPEEPTLLARAAAALLLASPDDAYGRAMFDRAIAHLHDSGGGRLVTASSGRAGVMEEVAASLALAVGAHQIGQDALARSLVAGAIAHDNLITERGGESLFWLLANGAYGVLGADAGTTAHVSAGGRSIEATFDHGIAIAAIDHPSGGVGVSARVDGDAIVIVRAEVAYAVPFGAETHAPMTLVLEGDPGAADGLSALELVVHATSEVPHPVVLLELPAGIDLEDEGVLARLASVSGVLDVEARRPGMVRIELGAIASGVDVRIPLALRWTLGGSVRGLAAVAYEADDPDHRTVIAPITIERSSGN